MKYTMLFFVLALSSGYAQAQKLKESEVPVAVKSAFAKRFPAVKHATWSKEDVTAFEAEFEVNHLEQSANFDAAGTWLATETEIKKGDLPSAVQATLSKEFAGYKIEEAEKAETSTGVFYEVEVEKGKTTYEVQISLEGKVLSKKEEKEGAEKD